VVLRPPPLLVPHGEAMRIRGSKNLGMPPEMRVRANFCTPRIGLGRGR
jgi:hypothetical protein